MRLGMLRNYQEWTVMMIQVRLLFGMLLHFFVYPNRLLSNLHFSILRAEGSGRLCVPVRDYYYYRLQTRPAIFNPILRGGRLFQQWGVDMYIKIEGCRVKWIRDHQSEIRADLYKGIADSIMAGETQPKLDGSSIHM